ncbi:YncE family protein [Brevundimonas faecalis]|uniref:YVTN family beta-propeller protein n=1 Tax=Brevundimonas faecalis TaxID=947378 RepID=A0ABV2R689_9CAUL
MTILRKGVLTAAALAVLATASAVSAQSIEKTVKVAPGGLYEIVFNPADNDVYVAAIGPRGENRAQVVRLDGRTLETETPVDVSANPLFGLGLNSRTQVLYGTDTRAGAVTAIDLKTGRVLATFRHGDEEGAHVREVIVDEQRNKAYVTIVGGDAGDASRPNLIWVIDGATNRVERTIAAPVGGLTGAALDVAANRLFVTGMGSNEVAAIDLANGQVVGKWAAGGESPTNVAVDAEGRRLFVANQKSGDLTVLNADTGALLQTVKTGEGALSVAYNPGVKQIYVANRQAGTVTVVDADTYAVKANLQTGTFPQTIAVDRATGAVYVTNKARGLPRGAPAGTPVPVDPTGDVVTLIRP